MKLLKLCLRVMCIPGSIFLCLTGYMIYLDRVNTDLKMWVPDRQEALKDPSEYKHPLQAPGSEKVNIRKMWEFKQKTFHTKNGIPTVFAITPTYYRLEQKADLTRLCQTFRLVENLHWILVEDSLNKTVLVKRLLNNCKVRSVHLNAVTPPTFKNIPGRKKFPRGVAQRNAALTWIREHVNPKETQGVVYFADDDNTYDVRIFEERYINSLSQVNVGASRFETCTFVRSGIVKYVGAKQLTKELTHELSEVFKVVLESCFRCVGFYSFVIKFNVTKGTSSLYYIHVSLTGTEVNNTRISINGNLRFRMRYTNVVSVWPVGLIAGGKFESPMVKDGKVVGWIFLLGTHRRFPTDMASFAFNVQLLFSHPEAKFNYTARAGTQESTILEGLNVTMSNMEPKANNCTEILVWHTRTQSASLVNQPKLQEKFKTVNFDLEV